MGLSALDRPTDGPDGAAHSGWLHRKAGLLGQNWELKYFVLQRDHAEGDWCLFAYKDGGANGKVAKSAVPLAKIVLAGGRLEEVADKTTWFSFRVVTSAGKAHTLRVAKEADFAAWCEHLRCAFTSA